MPRLDPLTRSFWRAKGREVDLGGAESWLDAPMHHGQLIGDAWMADAARRLGGPVVEGRPGSGLLTDMGALDGPGFRAADLRCEVRDFYEHTSDWRRRCGPSGTPSSSPAVR